MTGIDAPAAGLPGSQFDYIPTVLRGAIAETAPLAVKGKVSQVVGTIIRAVVPAVKVGEICVLRNPGEEFELNAEVVSNHRQSAQAKSSGLSA